MLLLAVFTRVIVALRKESVDRNRVLIIAEIQKLRSLSARRAWIEISYRCGSCWQAQASLSARRAWIEILSRDVDGAYLVEVALRKESVDRNSCPLFFSCWLLGRSPQGERG